MMKPIFSTDNIEGNLHELLTTTANITEKKITAMESPPKENGSIDAQRIAKNSEYSLLKRIGGSSFLLSRPFANEDVAPLDISEITLGDVIGQGAFSNVYKVTNIDCTSSKMMEKGNLKVQSQLKARQNLDNEFRGVSDSRVEQNDTGKKTKTKTKKCEFVVKHLIPDLFNLESNELLQVAADDIVAEASFLASINHPNILRLRGLSMLGPMGFSKGNADGFFLLLECLEEPLMDRIKRWKATYPTSGKQTIKFLEKTLKVAVDIASAVKYLHKNNIMHRDLKPSNLAFDVHGKMKLYDFGLAVQIPQKAKSTSSSDENSDESDSALLEEAYEMSGGTGSHRYMAPEVALHKPYNAKADVYSFTATLYEMLTAKRYCKAYEKTHCSFSTSVHLIGSRPAIDPKWPTDLQKALEEGWAHRHINRLSMEQLYGVLKEQHLLTVSAISSTAGLPQRRANRIGRIFRRSISYNPSLFHPTDKKQKDPACTPQSLKEIDEKQKDPTPASSKNIRKTRKFERWASSA